jgi:hypothetical protein
MTCALAMPLIASAPLTALTQARMGTLSATWAERSE